MTYPLVSICMITYNHAKYIAQSVESIVSQNTNFRFQLVIGDDGSIDDNRKICERLEKQYQDKITLLPKLEGNIGATANFIRTFKACKSKYVALCEGDDYWTDPLKLQKQVTILEQQPNYIFSAHGYHTVNSNNETTLKNTEEVAQLHPQGCEITPNNVFNIRFSKTLTILFKKEAVTQELFDYPMLTDTVLKFHLINKGHGFWLPQDMGAYRLHESNMFGTKVIGKKISFACHTWLTIVQQRKGDVALARTMYSKSLEHLLLHEVHPNNRMQFNFKRIIKFSWHKMYYATNKSEVFAFVKEAILPVLWLKFKMSIRKVLHV